MSLLDKLLDEYEKITDTEFWKVYNQKLRDKKGFQLKELVSSTDRERLPQIQGFIQSLGWVERLPSEILENFKEK